MVTLPVNPLAKTLSQPKQGKVYQRQFKQGRLGFSGKKSWLLYNGAHFVGLGKKGEEQKAITPRVVLSSTLGDRRKGGGTGRDLINYRSDPSKVGRRKKID